MKQKQKQIHRYREHTSDYQWGERKEKRHDGGSKSDRERKISYDIAYMWNLKNTTNKQTLRHRKQTYGYQRGEGGKEG